MADAWARCREAGVVASGRAAMWGRSSVRSWFECRLSADAGTATGLRCTFVAPLYGRMAVRMCVAPRACGLGVEGEGSRTESSMHPTEVGDFTFFREGCALPAEARDTRPADRCQRDQPPPHRTEPRTSLALASAVASRSRGPHGPDDQAPADETPSTSRERRHVPARPTVAPSADPQLAHVPRRRDQARFGRSAAV